LQSRPTCLELSRLAWPSCTACSHPKYYLWFKFVKVSLTTPALMTAASSVISASTEHAETNVFLSLDYNVQQLDMRPRISGRCVCDAATEHIRIGPFMFHWSQASNLELRVLYNLHHQIQNWIRLPVSADWIERLSGDPSTCHPLQRCRSWSGVIEAIARCVAAFQHAPDATEHAQLA
jgi:hypothetical protein